SETTRKRSTFPIDHEAQIGRPAWAGRPQIQRRPTLVIVECSNDIAASALHTRRPIPGVKTRTAKLRKISDTIARLAAMRAQQNTYVPAHGSVPRPAYTT